MKYYNVQKSTLVIGCLWINSRSSRRSSSSIRSKRAKAAARAACLEVEKDFLEREAEYKGLVMLKEIAKAKAEEEVMRKIEEEEENLSVVLKCETLIQDVKQNQAPKNRTCRIEHTEV